MKQNTFRINESNLFTMMFTIHGMIKSKNMALVIMALMCFNTRVALAQSPASDKIKHLNYEHAFKGLKFNQPTLMLQQPRNNNRFYLLEKSGRIYYFPNKKSTTEKQLYLDISQQKVDESFEGGLLGMAFDPDFEKNHYVYLSYTSSDKPEEDNSLQLESRISRFTANHDNSAILPDSEVIILRFDQPWNNHNGGHIAFASDGYLYAGYGDGGSWGDPNRNAQNTQTLLGKILRIDVSSSGLGNDNNQHYKIPQDNPFAESRSCTDISGCPEIYALGFRNPWRWSFDRLTGQLWVGDVGQGDREEIDLVNKGMNYGWNCYEGNSEYRLKLCDQELNYQKPVIDYPHMASNSSRDGMAASVTGGYVYRGKSVPALSGMYLYADFVHGNIWALPDPYIDQPEYIQLFDTDLLIVSFAEDNEGELYFLDYANGGIYRFTSSFEK